MIEKILILLVFGMVALMIFGNRLPQVLGDLGKGVRAFKDGMNEGNGDEPQPKLTKKPLAATRKSKASAKKSSAVNKAK